MSAVKNIVIALSLLVGVSFFYAGMGIRIPAVEFTGVTSYGVPIGMTFLVFAVAIARLWEDRPSTGLKG